ncbi:Mu transposase domain-containing protein [Alicyclobacillus suci]|uniref:Mu transposase domain-containing protein n=1 Tax=Alicyclobacillus suci TaxID=2816080 RepID=UPI001A8D717C|nr:hypothetical protein [Alicyclobacillus suci]
MATFNAMLLAWCEKERNKRWTKWEQERSALRPLPVHPHLCVTTRPVVVNKLCLVSFDHNRYSVPSIYVGKTLTLRSHAEEIELLDRGRVVATHIRCHERKQTFLQLEHYLPVLAYKPHAATHAAVVRQLPGIPTDPGADDKQSARWLQGLCGHSPAAPNLCSQRHSECDH